MWLSLIRGERCQLSVRSRQAIWPAPDGSDAELVINTVADVEQQVVIATPRVVRLAYKVVQMSATMALDDGRPAPWPDASAVEGAGFEVMITERGPLVVPEQGWRLPNRQALWLQGVAEDVRSSWTVPPPGARPGTEWTLAPIIPGGLPPGTSSATMDVRYRVEQIQGSCVDVAVQFQIDFTLDRTAGGTAGEGGGDMAVQVHQNVGVQTARRKARVEIQRKATQNQVIRTAMDLQRV
jgi:hypothetical protein